MGFVRTDATSSKLMTFVLGRKPAPAKVHEQQRAAVRFAAHSRPSAAARECPRTV